MQENFPMEKTMFDKFLNMGIIYGYKRDKGGRPVLVFNIERMLSSGVIINNSHN
jgi:hypothetical protein